MAKNFYTKEELEDYLTTKLPPLDVNMVTSAYEMSENANQDRRMPDGSYFFDHISRVCGLIVYELEIHEADTIPA